MADSDKTEVLIRRIQAGDGQARNDLYNRYLLRVLFLARVRLGAKLRRKIESWDIVQEALLKSLEGLSSFRYEGEQAFMAYLATKVEQAICDQADRWSAQKRDPNREIPLDGTRYHDGEKTLFTIQDLPDPASAPSPYEILAGNEDLRRLASTLDRLAAESPHYWQLIVAAKIEGRAYREIAAEQGTTVDAVKMMTRRALLKLARMYRAGEENQADGQH